MTTFSAAAPAARAQRHQRPRAVPTLVGLMAVPAGLVMALATPAGWGFGRIVAGVVVAAALVAWAWRLAGDRWAVSLGAGAAIAGFTSLAVVVEVPVVLATAFLFELLVPVAVFVALRVAKTFGPPPGPPPPPLPPTSAPPGPLPPPAPPEPGAPW